MNVVGEEFDIKVRSHCLHAQRFGSPSAPLVLGLHGLSLNMKSFDFIGERIELAGRHGRLQPQPSLLE